MAMDAVARGLGARALRRVWRGAAGPSVAFMGDSITAAAKVVNSTQAVWSSLGYATWARWLTRQRISTSHALMFATSGFKASDLIATWLSPALAAAPDVCVVHVGTNDIAGDVAGGTIVANLETIYSALNAAGILVVAVPVLPRGSGANFTTAQMKTWGYVNRWIRERALSSRGVLLADATTSFMDYSNNAAKSGLLYDNLHPGVAGAQVLGQVVATVLNQLLTPCESLFANSNDVYDATYNPTGNRLTNGLLSGTAGTLANNATGTPPDSWTATRSSSSASMSLAVSKQSHATLTGLSQTVLTLGGTAETGGLALLSQNASVTGLNAGDRVVMEADVEWDAPTNLAAIYGFLRMIDGSANATFAGDGTNSGSAGAMVSAAGSGVIRTEPLVVPAGIASMTAYLYVACPANTSAVSGVVRVSRVSVRTI